jgi:hypothetical protein
MREKFESEFYHEILQYQQKPKRIRIEKETSNKKQKQSAVQPRSLTVSKAEPKPNITRYNM